MKYSTKRGDLTIYTTNPQPWKHRLKMFARFLILKTLLLFGSEFKDLKTGEPLGKALVISFRGKVHVIGLQLAVQANFLPQQRITYWKQELGFQRHDPVNFPHVENRPHHS